MKNKNIRNILISTILGIFCFIAISFTPTYFCSSCLKLNDTNWFDILPQLRYTLHGFGIESTIIVVSFAFFIYKNYKKEKFNVKHILAILFSIFCIIGKCIYSVDDINVIFDTLANTLLTIFSFIGYFILFKIIINYIFNYLETPDYRLKNSKIKKIYSFVFNEHPFLAPLIILTIFYLPYLVITYPGTLFIDALNQLRQYDGIKPLTNHHPVVSTLMMGFLFNLGSNIMNQNFGIFLNVIIQFIIQLLVFAFVFVVYKKEDVKPLWRIITLVYFSLFCVFKINAVTIVKDTYFSIFMILYFLAYYYYIKKNKEKFNLKSIVPLVLSGILIYLFRNNGFYIILLSLVALIFLNKNRKRIITIVIVILGFITLNIGYHSIFLPVLNVHEGGVREMLSVPFQQTARYIKYYQNELSDEDKKLIKEVFVVDYKEIAKSYNSHNADPVKNKANSDCNKECAINYVKFYFKGLARHPKVYIDAYLSNYIGYLYPSINEHVNVKRDINGLGNYLLEYYNTKQYNFEFVNKEGVKNLQNIAYIKKQIPILGLLYSNGIYSWILIILIFYFINKKKYKWFILLSPIIAEWLFLFLGPIDTYLRYVVPIMAPLIIIISLINGCEFNVKLKPSK